MNSLRADLFNLDLMYTHISEFVRIDEHLRLKSIHLDAITPETKGWTYPAGIEISEHKTLINCIRCFLQYQSRQIWGQKVGMFSPDEYQTIKNFKVHDYKIYQDLPAYNTINNEDQLAFFVLAAHDKNATMELYKTLLGKLFPEGDDTYVGMSKNEIIQSILSKCVFQLS